MCGIVGIINKNKQTPELAVLTKMANTLDHRGPDEEGHYLENQIGFYHKRLSIIDLESGRQPMSFDGITITFNGEIYNYIELKQELIGLGHKFHTTSDTEVIIRMYLQHGLAFVEKLNGMFAFLLYDSHKNQVIAARDHFGIKPIYFHINDACLLFSSEIKAILQHPTVHAEPNYDSIQDYLTFQYVLGEATLFKNIHKMVPGSYQVISLNSMNINTVRYWEPKFHIDNFHTEDYFVYKLQELLDDTVNIQMRSDVPVGAYLSGGIDSSVVTALASKHATGPLKTFTGAFNEGPQFNETEYAKMVSDKCGADYFEIYPQSNEFVDLLPKLVYHMDEPVAGPGLFPQYIVSRFASKHVKVALGGQGGDEIFGGYVRYIVAYLEQALKGAIYESHEEGEHIVSLNSILPNLPYLKQYVPMMKSFWQKDAFEPMDSRYFNLIDRNGWPHNLYTTDFQNSFNKTAIFNRYSSIFNHPDTLSYFNKMTHFDMVSSLPALLHVEDRVSMANSLESRVPLLDRRIVDLITSIPPAMKFKGAEMKYILKKAIGNLLPEQIINRKDKMGFPVPLHIWAKNGAGDFFRDVLLGKKCIERGIINKAGIETLVNSEREFGRQLWGLMNLELWFEQFIDNN